MGWTTRRALRGLMLPLALATAFAHAQTTAPTASAVPPRATAASRNFAPGFSGRPAGSRLVVVPLDVELLSISAGGVPEPREDWTQAAQKYMRSALAAKSDVLGKSVQELSERDMDEFAQIGALHGAMAQSIRVHHAGPGARALPTKQGALDWTMGDAVQPLRARTGADYALFLWVRDSYASPERKAAMVGLALLGVAMPGGIQTGYASLVDLRSGRVVWFNLLQRGRGDLREEATARETVDMLLAGFPPAQ